MDNVAFAVEIRSRARGLREQGRRLKARAESLPDGFMREMLAAQADMLTRGAGDLEDRALALVPPMGTA